MDVITTHLNADFDGVASMVAGRKLYPDAMLLLPAGAQEAVRRFLETHDFGIGRLKDVDATQIRRLILMDAQEADRLGPYRSLFTNRDIALHIYDHHPPRGEPVDKESERRSDARLEHRHIEPVGATTTILIEALREQQLSVSPAEATLLAIGLYEETGFFSYASTTPRDIEAAAYVLGAGADLTVVTETLRQPLTPDHIALLNDLVQHADIFYVEGYKVMVATSLYDRYQGELADVVHRLAEMEGFDGVVAAIALGEKIEIIGRSRREAVDVGALARAFGGGGHATAAAATVKGRTMVEVRAQLTDWFRSQARPSLCARDVMTMPPKAVREEATVADVDRTMTTYGVNAMPVLDGSNHYAGIITRETIQKALFHKFYKTRVRELMQTEAYSATPATPFRDIEAAMIERNQRFVPILEGPTVVGVITRTDLLRTLHEDLVARGRPPAKGDLPDAPPRARNVRGQMKAHLPADVLALLHDAGALGDRLDLSVYVVGGFVRDLLLGRRNLDLDLVVEGDGIAYARELAHALGGDLKTHDRFGTAVVLLPSGRKIDLATARTEYYEYPTALPTVERSSIKKDLYRRDFTINALAIRLNAGRFGDVLDFYGGQRDLKDQMIRVLHSLSFIEDPTRVFRAIRFEHRFGFRIGKETLGLIKSAVAMDLFHRLSGSRLLTELVLLFAEDEPRKAVARLVELDLLRFIHPSLARARQLDARLKAAEDALDWYRLLYLDRPIDAWVVYVMVLMDCLPPQAVRETLRRLRMPERHAAKVRTARFESTTLLRRLSRRTALRPADVYQLLKGLPDEVLLFLMATAQSEAAKRHISAFVTEYRNAKPALTGDDLRGMGLKPGPVYRDMLEQLLLARVNGEVTNAQDERAFVLRALKRSAAKPTG